MVLSQRELGGSYSSWSLMMTGQGVEINKAPGRGCARGLGCSIPPFFASPRCRANDGEQIVGSRSMRRSSITPRQDPCTGHSEELTPHNAKPSIWPLNFIYASGIARFASSTRYVRIMEHTICPVSGIVLRGRLSQTGQTAQGAPQEPAAPALACAALSCFKRPVRGRGRHFQPSGL